MEIVSTRFKGLFILKPQVFADNRGHFLEAYNYATLKKAGVDVSFVQDNQSFSSEGVIRGLHYQIPPFGQVKLVRVLAGTILDVVVDLRPGEPTFKAVHSIELSAENRLQLLIPKGFAHGFSVSSKTAEVLYKCDNTYSKEHERGIIYNDPELAIDWQVKKDAIVSSKDLDLPQLKDASLWD